MNVISPRPTIAELEAIIAAPEGDEKITINPDDSISTDKPRSAPPSPELAQEAAGPAPASDGWEWAIVEIFGHRRHAGRIREEERFGAKMLRIDVPMKGDPITNGWETHWYGGSSIFSLTLTDEASALKINKPYEAPSRYQLPPPADEFDESPDDDDEASDQPKE